MNDESNVNTTQNPNVTATTNSTAVAQTGNTENNNTETVIVSSSNLEEASVKVTAPIVMPSIVNPLEVKVEEVKEEIKQVVPTKKIEDEQPIEKGPSEYAIRLQKAQENYTPPSKFKTIMTILMFVMIISFAAFLPEISSYISYIKAGGNQPLPKEPTTGVLTCTLETSTSNLDKTFTRKFSYEDNKLKSSVIETSTRGDVTLDEEILNELYNKCNLISKGVSGVDGISVKCEYTTGLLVERERFDYEKYNLELINAAYAEAGSTVLEFDYDANIDDIKKLMLQAGFTCKKDVK